jgi:hypothetical protein
MYLTGNTYEHKEKIKSCGGVWDKEKKQWSVPADKQKELQTLCDSTVKKSRRYECGECGDTVWSGTSCWETGLTH